MFVLLKYSFRIIVLWKEVVGRYFLLFGFWMLWLFGCFIGSFVVGGEVIMYLGKVENVFGMFVECEGIIIILLCENKFLVTYFVTMLCFGIFW